MVRGAAWRGIKGVRFEGEVDRSPSDLFVLHPSPQVLVSLSLTALLLFIFFSCSRLSSLSSLFGLREVARSPLPSLSCAALLVG